MFGGKGCSSTFPFGSSFLKICLNFLGLGLTVSKRWSGEFGPLPTVGKRRTTQLVRPPQLVKLGKRYLQIIPLSLVILIPFHSFSFSFPRGLPFFLSFLSFYKERFHFGPRDPPISFCVVSTTTTYFPSSSVSSRYSLQHKSVGLPGIQGLPFPL